MCMQINLENVQTNYFVDVQSNLEYVQSNFANVQTNLDFVETIWKPNNLIWTLIVKPVSENVQCNLEMK